MSTAAQKADAKPMSQRPPSAPAAAAGGPPDEPKKPTTQAEYMKALRELLPKDRNGNPKFVTEPKEFNETVEKLAESGVCNLLCSLRYIDSVPPVQAISFRVMTLQPEDFYEPSWAKGGLALKGETLTNFLREASGSFLRSERLDDGNTEHYRHLKGHVRIRGMNGMYLTFSKDREIDLRPGAAEYEAMYDPEKKQYRTAQIAQARQTIGRVCETKAQLRAVRAALGVKQAYSFEDARKPYVIPVLVPNPDMSNPAHAAYMLAHSTDSVELVYGRSSRALPAHEPEPTHGAEPDTTRPGAGRVLEVDPNTGEIVNELRDPDDETGEVEMVPPNPFEDQPIHDDLKQQLDVTVCTCPCGCRNRVESEVMRAKVVNHLQALRCMQCYPLGNARFDRGKHSAEMDAKVPKYPHMTFGQLLELGAGAGGGK